MIRTRTIVAWWLLAFVLFIVAVQPGPASAATCGTASYYGKGHQGRTMANGKPFNMYAMTAAMWGPKFGARYLVRNVQNGRTVQIVITDRGPNRRLNRLIDLSYAAAKKLGFTYAGLASVCLTRLPDAPLP